MAGNGWKWLEMARMAVKGWKWLEFLEKDRMAGNGWKWEGMAGNGWKWEEMADIKLMCCYPLTFKGLSSLLYEEHLIR